MQHSENEKRLSITPIEYREGIHGQRPHPSADILTFPADCRESPDSCERFIKLSAHSFTLLRSPRATRPTKQ
jgi:hypothetical protein